MATTDAPLRAWRGCWIWERRSSSQGIWPRRGAIIGEGAELVVVGGTYDDAVERSAEADGLLISDTSWSG